MCDDNDLEGVRLWFYGGTPPLDELDIEDQNAQSPRAGWLRLVDKPERGPRFDNENQLAAA